MEKKTYVTRLSSLRVIDAPSAAEALSEARDEFIELLQRGEAELVVVEELEDPVNPEP